jgi:hypothetical protein
LAWSAFTGSMLRRSHCLRSVHRDIRHSRRMPAEASGVSSGAAAGSAEGLSNEDASLERALLPRWFRALPLASDCWLLDGGAVQSSTMLQPRPRSAPFTQTVQSLSQWEEPSKPSLKGTKSR